jgi:C-terminal processing protease CtpA/Prc
MKPTETIPVGLQLTKQTDPCQYIMTDIVEQSQADLAGLKVDDWLIKIEDKDIRLTDLKDIYQLFNNLDFINMAIARKKSSVDLSNPNLDKIRHITLKEISELYFDSFISDTNDQIHFISNIQPISIAYQSGLRNNDRILTINGIDVTKTSKEDLQLMILKNKSIQLTVINDSKYFQSIENFKYNKIQKILPPIIYETIDHRKLNHFNNILFIDDQGPVYLKHCIVKPESSYNALGFSLYYKDDFHIINNIEKNFPGYNYGLRNHDIILFVNKKNIQQLLSNDLTMLIRSLVITNKIIDLIILKKNDLQRYKNYQTKKSIDWNSILSNIYNEGSGGGGTRVVQQYQSMS